LLFFSFRIVFFKALTFLDAFLAERLAFFKAFDLEAFLDRL
jgi:hypothetical protein